MEKNERACPVCGKMCRPSASWRLKLGAFFYCPRCLGWFRMGDRTLISRSEASAVCEQEKKQSVTLSFDPETYKSTNESERALFGQPTIEQQINPPIVMRESDLASANYSFDRLQESLIPAKALLPDGSTVLAHPECPPIVVSPDKTEAKVLGAVRDDSSKPRYDLVPAYAFAKVVDVLTAGARKYADRNWEKGFKYSRVFASLMRHCWAFWSGETHDKETGIHHMAHVACNALFLVEYENTGAGEDDRPCK